MAEKIHPAIRAEFRRMEAENKALQVQMESQRKQIESLERREVHLDDMPGKLLPYKYQINITLEAGTSAATTGTVSTSRDGPFVARRLYASLLITTAPSSPTNWSHMANRFSPVTSRETYIWWAVTAHGDLTNPVYPLLDFEWEYSDGGSDRNRQDKAISGDILTKYDEDGYFMNNEIFAAGTTISFTVTPLRAIQTGFDVMFKATFDGYKVLQPLEM